MEEAQNQQSPNLSLADITLALQIIQVASQRGAFKTEEFAEVGGCYNRILSFLEAAGAVTKNDAADTEVTDPAEPATVKKATPKSKGKTK